MFYTILDVSLFITTFLILSIITGVTTGFIMGGLGALARWAHAKYSDWE